MKKAIITFNLLIISILAYNPQVNAMSEAVQAVINAVSTVNNAHPDGGWATVAVDGSTVSVGCTNGAHISTVNLTPEEVSEAVAYIGTVSTVSVANQPPPPPPAPVISYSNYTDSCTYISGWNEVWGDCNISSSWNTNGTIQCIQNGWYDANYSNANLNCTITYSDGAEVGRSCDPCPGNVSRPSDPSPVTKTVTANLSGVSSTCNGNVYANNSDSCNVSINVSSPTNQGRGIASWGSNGNVSNIIDLSGEKSDRIANTGTALNFSSVSAENISNSTGNNFDIVISGIKSTTPFSNSNAKIGLNLGSTQMVANNVNYSFKKPFAGSISTWNNTANNWTGTPRIGTLSQYKLSLVQKSTITSSDLNNYSLVNFNSKIEPIGDGVSVQSNVVNDTTLSDALGTTFNARLNTTAGASSVNQNPGLQINNPIIKYNLGGQNVSYYLTEGDTPTDSSNIKTTGGSFMSIKVEGTTQSSGKATITGQAESNSNLYPANMRTPLRKNAYTYVKSMKNGDVFDKVKYIEGQDIEISGDQTYETLVVKDGNVVIIGDLNPSNKTLGIIVLKDAYDLNDGYSKKGNIYIKPNVTKVNAVIYADGGIISVNSGLVPYSSDSSTRSNELNKQLMLNGSFFTRNTIGGAVLAGGEYILPGGSSTSDFDLAMQYDLNYLRRGNAICDSNGNNCTSAGTSAPVIIKYNPKVQTAPPKLFSF